MIFICKNIANQVGALRTTRRNRDDARVDFQPPKRLNLFKRLSVIAIILIEKPEESRFPAIIR